MVNKGFALTIAGQMIARRFILLRRFQVLDVQLERFKAIV
jgi:hypothetical protein